MGHWGYCKRCCVPVKCDDTNDYTYCGHGAKEIDYLVFERGMHYDLYLYGWNLTRPFYRTTRAISYGSVPSPYLGGGYDSHLPFLHLDIIVCFNEVEGFDQPWKYVKILEELGHNVHLCGSGHEVGAISELQPREDGFDLILEIETPSEKELPYRDYEDVLWLPAVGIVDAKPFMIYNYDTLKKCYTHGVHPMRAYGSESGFEEVRPIDMLHLLKTASRAC